MPKSKNLDFSNLILEAELADYSPVRGCMVIRPYGYEIWEHIQASLDKAIKSCGHKNAYFPLFIPESFLHKEAEHVEGFAPECAVVTHAGGQKLEEPLIVRPTSETMIYHMFAKWIKSWRDLPYSVNQWANVVRWEMRTRPFLRTTEFLWQEGHTAHPDSSSADNEARRMLKVYEDFFRNNLALSPVVGEKTALERFAGAQRTYSLEVLLRDGKILQGGTSHYLGQGFAEAFGIQYQDKDNNLQYAHLTSWGVSTRLIGALVMGHRDEHGLILPPQIAPIQVVIIPIYKQENERELVLESCQHIKDQLLDIGIRVELDDKQDNTPGYKFNHWEVRGVPLRIHIGPRDVAQKAVELARRDTLQKIKNVSEAGLAEKIKELLAEIQSDLLDRHQSWRLEHTSIVDSLDDMNEVLNERAGFVRIHWAGNSEQENELRELTKASIRVQPFTDEVENGHCLISGNSTTQARVYAGRAY